MGFKSFPFLLFCLCSLSYFNTYPQSWFFRQCIGGTALLMYPCFFVLKMYIFNGNFVFSAFLDMAWKL